MHPALVRQPLVHELTLLERGLSCSLTRKSSTWTTLNLDPEALIPNSTHLQRCPVEATLEDHNRHFGSHWT